MGTESLFSFLSSRESWESCGGFFLSFIWSWRTDTRLDGFSGCMAYLGGLDGGWASLQLEGNTEMRRGGGMSMAFRVCSEDNPSCLELAAVESTRLIES